MKLALTLLVQTVFAMAAETETPSWRAHLDRANLLREAASDEAQAVFLEAAARAKEIPDGGLALARVGNDLALDHQVHGRHLEAAQLLRATLIIYQHNPRSLPLDAAATMHNLAVSCRALANREEAESLHRKAIGIIEEIGGKNHPKLTLALSFLGILYAEQGRLAEAEPLFIRATRIGAAASGPSNPDLVFSLSGQTMVQRLRGDGTSARRTATRALRIAESAYGQDSVRTAGILHQLAGLDFEIGRLKSAESLWRRALEIVQKKRSPNHPDALNMTVQLGDIARLRGRYVEAEALLTRAVREAEQPGGGPMLAVALHHLAMLDARRGRHERADPLFRRSLAITGRDLGNGSVEGAICAANFARTLVALERTDEAERWSRFAVEAGERADATRHPFFLEALRDHARILSKLGRKQEAKEVSARLEAILASGAGRTSDYTVSIAELKSPK